MDEPGRDFGIQCKSCKHDLLHHVGYGECYKNKHTVRRCKCKQFVGKDVGRDYPFKGKDK